MAIWGGNQVRHMVSETKAKHFRNSILQSQINLCNLPNVEKNAQNGSKYQNQENGFINYFGQQRFGTDSTIKTSDIGLALIKENWQEAIGKSKF